MAVAAAAAVIVACKGDDESVSPDSSTPLPVTFAIGGNDFDDAADHDTRGGYLYQRHIAGRPNGEYDESWKSVTPPLPLPLEGRGAATHEYYPQGLPALLRGGAGVGSLFFQG